MSGKLKYMLIILLLFYILFFLNWGAYAITFKLDKIIDIPYITCAALIQQRGLLLVCTEEGAAHLITAKTGAIVKSFQHTGAISACAVTHQWIALHQKNNDLILYKFLSLQDKIPKKIGSIKNIAALSQKSTPDHFMLVLKSPSDLYSIVLWQPDAPGPEDFKVISKHVIKPELISSSNSLVLAEYRMPATESHLVVYKIKKNISLTIPYPHENKLLSDMRLASEYLITASAGNELKYWSLDALMRIAIPQYELFSYIQAEKLGTIKKLSFLAFNAYCFIVTNKGFCMLLNLKTKKISMVALYLIKTLKLATRLSELTYAPLVELIPVDSHEKLYIITRQEIFIVSCATRLRA